MLYHALNGVRIILMDLGVGVHRHKAIFWVCMLVAALSLACSPQGLVVHPRLRGPTWQ